jgi:hypothetical protein
MNDIDQQLRDAGARLRAGAPTPDATQEALQGLGDLRLDREPNRRRRATVAALAVAAAAAAVVGIVVMTRPTDDPVVSTDTSGPAQPPTTALPATTGPATTGPSTTGSATTATTPTTPSMPDTVPPAAAPWTTAPLPDFGLVTCCGANASGPTSPEFTPAGQALADGVYWADVSSWSQDDPTRLGISVRRLVPCADGVRECSPYADGTYGEGEVGLSDDERPLEVPLDATTVVELLGAEPVNASSGTDPANRRSDGTGLSELLSSLAASYDELIASPIESGAQPDEVVADLRTNPRGGFVPAPEDMGQLYFTHGDAPAVLFQSVAARDENNVFQPLPRSGTSPVDLTAIEVRDGVVKLYFYAGFIS